MKIFQKSVASIVILIALAGCGRDPGDRAISGAGIGAGVGAVGGALVGGSVGGGALLGGIAGAAAGGLTSSRNLDLGRPIWK